MPKQMTCTDGVVITGEDDQDLIANVRQHIKEAHPDQTDDLSDDEILKQAVDV